MIINGLEELDEEFVKSLNLDNLQFILLAIEDLEPVKELGKVVHIGNLKEEDDLSFELDNGKELIEIHITEVSSLLSITIYKDKRAIHYLYNVNNRKVINEQTFLQSDNLLLKYRIKDKEYFFELYNYENTSDTRIYFKTKEFDVNDFVKKLFVEEEQLNEIINVLPKEYLKIKQITLDYVRDIMYQDNKLLSDIKGEYDEEGRKER